MPKHYPSDSSQWKWLADANRYESLNHSRRRKKIEYLIRYFAEPQWNYTGDLIFWFFYLYPDGLNLIAAKDISGEWDDKMVKQVIKYMKETTVETHA